jgi:1,4-alpha-glucan branching enzyme
MLYAYNENFVLPLSHDEVVHGKGSILGKMPGDDWQKFANLRSLYAYMFAQPGKKLLFMGSEFGQWSEWSHEESISWHLTQWERHSGIQKLLTDLNHLYSKQPALHNGDCDSAGFRWISAEDAAASVYAFERIDPASGETIITVFNLTPVVRDDYSVGVDEGGLYRVLLNTDAKEYGGSGAGTVGSVAAEKEAAHGRLCSIALSLPPLGALYLKLE